MKVEVDRTVCAGHGICEAINPAVFQVRDDGSAHVVRDALDEAVWGDVEAAVAGCPAQAVHALRTL